MSKTLSANITAGIAANSRASQFLIEIESATTLYRWATFPCNSTKVSGWTGPDFESKIAKKGIGKIRRWIDISEGGNVSAVQKWNFKIPNQGLISDTLATEDFIGRRAEIRLIFTDQTGPSWMNAVQLAPVGYIEDVTWDEDTVIFFVNDGPLKKHRDLPKRKLTVKDFPDLLQDNRNKIVPMIYGDWTLGNGVNRSALASNIDASSQRIHRDYFKGYLLGPLSKTDDGADNARCVFAGHDMHTCPPANQQEYKFGWSEDIRRFYLNNARYGSGDTFGAVHPGLYTKSCYQPTSNEPDYSIVPDYISSSGSVADPTYAIDEDDSNATVLTSNGSGATVMYKIRGNAGRIPDGYQLAAYFYASKTGIANDTLDYRVSKDGSVLVNWTAASVWDALHIVPIAWNSAYAAEPLAGLTIEFRTTSVAAADGGTFSIRSAYFFVLTPRQEYHELLETGKGRMFGSWIDSPDHSNAFNSGDLIQNPAYAVESLLVDELNLKVKERGAAIQTQDAAISTPFFQVPDDASLQLAGIVSIECWVKLISIGAWGENFIVAKIDAGGDIAPYALSVSTGGKVRFWRGDGTTSNYLESAATLSTGTWYHIVATAAGGSGATRYIHINGVYDNGSSIVQAVADGANVLRIGLRAGAATRTNMILDELRIWDRVITEGEAKQLYNGGSGYPRPYYPGNTKAWWRFDEEGRTQADGSTPGGAFTVTDSSGNGNGAASNNHANMRWVTGASAKVPYTESEVQENDSTTNAQSSFDVVAATRSSWLFARQYLDVRNSIDMIREICKEAHFGYFTNYLGEDTIARIDGGATGYAPPTLSKFRLQGEKSSVSVKRGLLKNWYNEFVLHYKVNVVTGEPEETLFVNTPDGVAFDASYTNLASAGEDNWDLCAAAYNSTLQVNRWEYTAKNIRDAATAELALKAVIAHLTRRPYIVDGKTGLALIVYELLDLVKISHPLLPAAVSGINRFRLIGQEIDCNECEITSTFFDVGVVSEIPS